MNLLLAVIDDLYSFALGAILHLFKTENTQPLGHFPNLELAPPPRVELLLAQGDERIASSFRTIEDVLTRDERHTVTEGKKNTLSYEKNTVMYVGSTDAALYKQPTQEFDTVLGSLPYGEMVMVLDQKNRFAQISTNGFIGWVLREDLVDRAAFVYPELVIGLANEVDDPNTIRLRAMIRDEFGGARVEFPLQAGEYVTYRLLRKGLTISWPEVRPRVPGLWHTILKGVTGIHMGVSPKTGSIMEYMITEDMGHLAYVEAVFPDETVTLSEVNYPDRGIYNERVLTREEWRELKPIFIQVS